MKSFEPEVVSKADVSQETLDAVKKGLYEVVNMRKGTAWWYRGRGIHMAGKTGTAQVISMTSKELFSKCEEMPYRNRHHGLFVAFAPFENPKIAVAAVVEHGCHGSSAGAPIVRDVMETYMKKYYPEDYEKYAKEDKLAYLEMIRKEKEERIKKEADAAAEENTPAPSDDE